MGVSFEAGKLTVESWLIDTAQPSTQALSLQLFMLIPALLLHNTGKTEKEIIIEKASKTGQLASFHLEDE